MEGALVESLTDLLFLAQGEEVIGGLLDGILVEFHRETTGGASADGDVEVHFRVDHGEVLKLDRV